MRPCLCIAESPSAARAIAQIVSLDGFRTEELGQKRIPVHRFHILAEGFPREAAMLCFTQSIFELSFRDQRSLTPTIAESLSATVTATINLSDHELCDAIMGLAADCEFCLLFFGHSRTSAFLAAELDGILKRSNEDIRVYNVCSSTLTPDEVRAAVVGAMPFSAEKAAAALRFREVSFRASDMFSHLLRRAATNVMKRVPRLTLCPSALSMLAWIVSRFYAHLFSESETAYTIDCQLKTEVGVSRLKWGRKRVFCQLTCFALYTRLLTQQEARVVAIEEVRKVIPRPLPLTCARLVALAADHLEMDPRITLVTAYALYEKGYISHPYADCDCFPDHFDFKSVLAELTAHVPVAQQAGVLATSFEAPLAPEKTGQATPIYPCAVPVGMDPQTNEYKVFDFIARHFIAICSHDSVIIKSLCRIQIGGEIFQLAVPVRQELNWLDIFPFPTSAIARIGMPLPLRPGEVVTAKSMKMIAIPPQPRVSVRSAEIIRAADSGTRAVDDLMGLATQKLIHKARDGFKPSPLGVAVTFAFARAGFGFEDPWLMRMFDDLESGAITDTVGVIGALAAIGAEMIGRAQEIEEVFSMAIAPRH